MSVIYIRDELEQIVRIEPIKMGVRNTGNGIKMGVRNSGNGINNFLYLFLDLKKKLWSFSVTEIYNIKTREF